MVLQYEPYVYEISHSNNQDTYLEVLYFRGCDQAVRYCLVFYQASVSYEADLPIAHVGHLMED